MKKRKLNSESTIDCGIQSIEEVIALIEMSSNIIVIAGAGISVSCGIPDFRSKKTGLYNSLDCAKIGIPSPELLFDIEYFKIDPAPFYKYATCLLPNDNIQPSDCHKFIATLEAKQKLLRVYTQNVDGLERKAGITNLMECHGTMMEFQCLSCKKRIPLNDQIRNTISVGKICYCTNCKNGIVKPSVTFFGEQVTHSFEKLMRKDVAKCDLVIVVGTSLKVGGTVNELLKNINKTINRILINKDMISSKTAAFDVAFNASLVGDCNCIVNYITSKLNWVLQESVDSECANNNSNRNRSGSSSSTTDNSIASNSRNSIIFCVKVPKKLKSISKGISSTSTASSASSTNNSIESMQSIINYKYQYVNAIDIDLQTVYEQLEDAKSIIDDLYQFNVELMNGLHVQPQCYLTNIPDVVYHTHELVDVLIPFLQEIDGIEDRSECEYVAYSAVPSNGSAGANRMRVQSLGNQSNEIDGNPSIADDKLVFDSVEEERNTIEKEGAFQVRYINRTAWLCTAVPIPKESRNFVQRQSVFCIVYDGESDKQTGLVNSAAAFMQAAVTCDAKHNNKSKKSKTVHNKCNNNSTSSRSSSSNSSNGTFKPTANKSRKQK